MARVPTGWRKEKQELLATIESLQKRVTQLESENQLLKAQKQCLMRRMFGRSSEQLDSRQMELLLGMKAESLAGIPMEPKPTLKGSLPRAPREHKPRIPEDLPTEEVVIEPEAVLKNPSAFRCIGREVTQELDVTPAKYIRRLLIRPKYVSKTDRTLAPILADLPPRLIEGGYAGPGLLTDILLKKYMDHLPLHRQEQRLRTRYGIELSRQTMADWVQVVADRLGLIYDDIRKELQKSRYLQVDETPIRYCRAEGGGSRQGYFWVYLRPGGSVLYEWHTSRSAACLNAMLDDFAGNVGCDDFRAYDSYARQRNQKAADAGQAKAIELSRCWAHVRRKFYEAQMEAPGLVGWLLGQIAAMYRIENILRKQRAGSVLREVVRSAQTTMMLTRIRKVLECKAGRFLPQSRMGQAIRYTLGIWNALVRFRDHGELEIDNNLVENAIRPTALGKKNWLFIGHPDAGRTSAIIYTLLENCRRLGINPYNYLHDVLTRLPTTTNWHVHELTPANWMAAKKAKAVSVAA